MKDDFLILSESFVEKYNRTYSGYNNMDVFWHFSRTTLGSEIIVDDFIAFVKIFLNIFKWMKLQYMSFYGRDYYFNDLLGSKLTTIDDWAYDLKTFFYPLSEFNLEYGYEFVLDLNINYKNYTDSIISDYISDFASYIKIEIFLKNDIIYETIIFKLRPDFFYHKFNDKLQIEIPCEFAYHNKNLLTNSLKAMKLQGYNISYLPINYIAKAYINGARWDETGFLEYGKYSKYLDNDLINLYKMMIKNNEDLSEIVLELQVRNLPR